MPHIQRKVECSQINSPLCKWTNGDDMKQWTKMCALFSRKNMESMKNFDDLNTIFKYYQPKVPNTQDFLGYSQPK
jgi:hypothetical protein